MNSQSMRSLWRSLLGAFIFYTIAPIPQHWQPSFHRIARWCPFIGLMLGGCLALIFLALTHIQAPPLVISAIVVSLWLGLTGGLHLDGAMDSADGLATTNPERRLEVMADSVTGAFGAMTAGIILLLKFAAIASLSAREWWLFPLILSWGRWAQVTAIAFYPYLKPTGKGAFHKQDFQQPWDYLLSFLPSCLLSLCLIPFIPPQLLLISNLMGVATGTAIAAGFQHKFSGQTGDTYGAIVEWTESLLLILNSIILQSVVNA